jgi:hypothetical protein
VFEDGSVVGGMNFREMLYRRWCPGFQSYCGDWDCVQVQGRIERRDLFRVGGQVRSVCRHLREDVEKLKRHDGVVMVGQLHRTVVTLVVLVLVN